MSRNVFVFLIAVFFLSSLLAAQERVFVPQVVDGENPPANTGRFATRINLMNPSPNDEISVTLTFFNADGNAVNRLPGQSPGGPSVRFTRTIPPSGAASVETANGPFTIVGWIEIEATGDVRVEAITRFISNDGRRLFSARNLCEPPVSEFSAFAVLNRADSSTAVALLNTSETEAAEVTARLIDSQGQVFREVIVVIPPGQKIARFLTESEFFPDAGSFFGTVEMSSTVPLAVTIIEASQDSWTTMKMFTTMASN
ncbi:MAG TPA: hypothetical protein VKZ59_00015 [Acidobacteriota bacterium]|nr:hypothetical protein [Acidobacteriota bacterium]